MSKKAHLVFVPSPGITHLVSTVEFAKLLVTRDHRLFITIFVIDSPLESKTTPYTQSLASSSFSDSIHIINLTQTPTPSPSETIPIDFLTSLIESQKPHIKEAVSDLTRSHSAPPLAAFVLDMFCTTMIDIANEFEVPALVFYTSGLAFLGLVLHVHTLIERGSLDIAQLEGSDTELAIPSFSVRVPARSLPMFLLRKDWEPYFLSFMRGLKKAHGFIVNSFEELESHAVRSFYGSDLQVYPVGPILNLTSKDDADAEVIKWLDDQPPLSVVFLCFGSMGWFGEDQLREIARALEDSGARFLWSLRKPPSDGTGRPSEYTPQEMAAVLPHGFLDRTAGIGRVVTGWAPQAQVLAHQATGGFVSHCGWNSILESIYFGVPIAAWPLSAEQQTNAFEVVCELRVAVEISLDYRMGNWLGSETVVSAEKIERGIRGVLEKDGEVRKRVKEMSHKSRNTVQEGGCSHSHLGRFIDYVCPFD